MTMKLSPIERLTFESHDALLMIAGCKIIVQWFEEETNDEHIKRRDLQGKMEIVGVFLEVLEDRVRALDATCGEVEENRCRAK